MSLAHDCWARCIRIKYIQIVFFFSPLFPSVRLVYGLSSMGKWTGFCDELIASRKTTGPFVPGRKMILGTSSQDIYKFCIFYRLEEI